MPVALVARWQFHVISVGNTAKLVGISRSFKRITFKDNILMWNHTSPWILLVKPRTVRMHIQLRIAEKFTYAAKHREDYVMQNVVGRLR